MNDSKGVNGGPAPGPTGSGSSSRVADWVGFLAFGGLAAETLYVSPKIGLTLLPTILQELAVAAVFLTREPSRDTIRTIGARVAAYTGSFIVLAFIQAARVINPDWLEPTSVDILKTAGAALWLAGILFSYMSLWWLRRSFSIEPAARRLITDGPYRFARHPVYSGYIAYYLGTLLIYPSAAYGVVLVIWCVATAVRMRYEETVLRRAFPEQYAAYSSRVGIFAPVMRPQRLSESPIQSL